MRFFFQQNPKQYLSSLVIYFFSLKGLETHWANPKISRTKMIQSDYVSARQIQIVLTGLLKLYHLVLLIFSLFFL